MKEKELELFVRETEKRIASMESLCDAVAMQAEWKNLLRDEPSRAHFMRLLLTVHTSIEVMKSTGNPIPNGKEVQKGVIKIINHVTKAAVVQDYLDGKLK